MASKKDEARKSCSFGTKKRYINDLGTSHRSRSARGSRWDPFSITTSITMAEEILENELRALEAFLEQELGEVLGDKPQRRSSTKRNQK